MADTQRVRRPFALLSWGVLFAGLTLLAYSLTAFPVTLTARFALLCAATLVAENFALSMSGYGVSLTYPLLIALAITCGPSGAMVGALLSAVNREELEMRLPLPVHAFNVGQLLLWNGAAAWVYVLLGGRVLTDALGQATQMQVSDFPEMWLPLAAMAVTGALANVALIALAYSFRQARPLPEALREVGWLPPVQIALAGVGILLAQVLAVSAAALPLFIFPLFVARQFYQRFMGLQQAYTETIRSLVTGLEAKDPYTRGHSERVAGYAVQLAHACGMDEREVRDVETAALLHDLGKLSIGGSVLRKPGKLDDDEWAVMKRHPETGALMVERIPHLRFLSDAVLKHHERLNGSGYPEGLRGDAIPEVARILAIADSFDAMTTDRPYRPGFSTSEALAELGSCVPDLYDSRLVEHFVTVVASGNLTADKAAPIRSAIADSVPKPDAS